MRGLGQRVRREARRALSRLPNVSPASFARTVWRAVTLHLREPRRRTPSRPERIVVTLTTTPARARRLRPTLRSLLDQSEPPDRVLLALPHHSRTGQPYPDVAQLRLPDGIEVVRCIDEGPASKILPALALEADALLVVADDDVIYPDDLIETLLRAHRKHPRAAVGYRGVKLRQGMPFAEQDHVFATGIREATPVDILFGTWSYLVPPGLLGAAVFDLASAPAELRWVDDIWISGHLARAGAPRLVVDARQLPIDTPNALYSSLTSGINASGRNDEIALQYFRDDW